MFKFLKRISITLALAAIFAVTAALSACTITTKHPRATISVEFEGVTYDIQYTLYRNMYPKTVQHFIELADSGFYDGMIVHDYETNEWYTGGINYAAEEGGSPTENYASAYTTAALREYLTENDKEREYYNLFNSGALTPSVYSRLVYDKDGNATVSAEDALPTLIGEFRDNDHNIEKGALTSKFGVLKMYYYDKGTVTDYKKVAIKNWNGEIMEHDYRFNCATSVFSIQCSSSSNLGESRYCVFGQLRNGEARGKLEQLLDAIDDYIEDNYSSSTSFTTTVSDFQVDNLDNFAEEDGRGLEEDFTLTASPIIIRSVKINKY